MTRSTTFAFVMAIGLALTACGGGGGGVDRERAALGEHDHEGQFLGAGFMQAGGEGALEDEADGGVRFRVMNQGRQ